MRHRQRRDHGPQQFALTRAGGPDQQAVWPVALNRALLQVEPERAPVSLDTERRRQEVPAGQSPP